MLGRSVTVTVKEYALPVTPGKFTLEMGSERTVLGIFNKAGANLLLIQEKNGTDNEESSFEAVESGSTIHLAADFQSTPSYLGSYLAGDKLLHLFGVKSIASSGGAASVGGLA